MPTFKRRPLTTLDLPAAGKGTASVDTNPTADDVSAPPVPQPIGIPQGLALATGVGYSSAAPTAYIDATWLPPETTTGAFPESYTLQTSTNVGFTPTTTRTNTVSPSDPDAPSYRVEGLTPGVLHYVRVRAIAAGYPGDWTAGVSITTATDLIAAGVPTSPAAVWVGFGDLLITWVNPTQANFKDVEITIRASSGGTIYRQRYSAAGSFVYPLAWNYQDTAGVGDSSLYVELKSRTFSNVLSSAVNTGLVTKGVPGTPTGVTQSWSGDTGTAGPDLTIAWTDAIDAGAWILTLDGVGRRIVGNRYTYTLDANRAEHAGTPDPAIGYSLVAKDGFGQSSTAVSGTATNAAPAAPVATLTQGVVSGLYASVTSTPPADFWRNEFVFKRDGTTVATVFSSGASYRYEMQLAADEGFHSWTVVVRQQDLFAQFSATHTPSAVAFESLTLGGLRKQARYSDSEGNTAVALDALKDGVTTSGGLTYPA